MSAGFTAQNFGVSGALAAPGFALALILTLALVAAVAALARARRAAAAAARESETLRDEIWELKAAAAGRDRAEAASEAKSRFLAAVSHEIRTPLNGVLGMVDLMSDMRLGPEANSYLAAMRTSGVALVTLIDEILDFSRIEAGKLEVDATPFDLAQLVEGVVELLAPRAQGKGVDLACVIAADLPERVIGDPARVRQILLNLAGNAIKFTERGGVGLRVARAGERVVFRVEDTGPGVPAPRRATIFEEFERADGSATSAHGGTGLGLAISRALAERLGGSVALERSAATGSVFALDLPLKAADPVATGQDSVNPTPRDPPPADCAPPCARALVVARSPFEAPFLCERLAAAGVAVARADDEHGALAALDHASRQPSAQPSDQASDQPSDQASFDAVIVDCALGETTARAIAAAARAAGVRRTLVLVSPFERRALDRAVFAAFDGWLVKPVRRASLLARLRERESPAQAAEGGGGRLGGALAGRRALVAEDNDINALIVMRQLERAGAQVVRVVDGAAALETLAAADDPFDVTIMDIRMPRCDGLTAARAVRAREAASGAPRAPLIALTANASQDDRRAAEEAGFDRFLVKPFAPDALIAAIGALLAPPRTTA